MEQLIFTDWPRGKGVDPAASGLQIKACSEGLTESERWQLGAISMHLGQAFTPMNAPHSATEREQSWLSKAQNFQQIPADVTAAFPVIWSYHGLSESRYALTRTHYTCLTHDQRTGNFLAHTLVLDPANLDEQHSNPLLLGQCGLFLSQHTSDETSLPALPDGIVAVPSLPNTRFLQQDPYRSHLAAMISALIDVTAARRPVLLALSNWRDAEPLTAILLELLPPPARRLVTFCTYDIDRTWTLPSKSGKSGGVAHQLIVLCKEGDQSLHLRADEYQNTYAVFNFIEDRFSELSTEHPYAKFAAECALNGQMSRLSAYHRLLARFGTDMNRAAWDQLLYTEQVSSSASPEIIQQAASALAEYVSGAAPVTAGTALDLLKPRIQTLAQENDFSTLATIGTSISKLVEHLPDSATETTAQKQAYIDLFFSLAEQAFTNGQARSAQALLKACGPDRAALRLNMLARWADKSPAALPKPSGPLDQSEAFNMMLDALQTAEKLPDPIPSVEWLLVGTFSMAQLAGQSSDAWKRLGDSLVKPRLTSPWTPASGKLAQELRQYIHAADCPEGCIWLNTKILQENKPEGKALTALLSDLARAAAHSSQPAKMIAETIQLARSRFDSPEKMALALGMTTEATFGTTSFKVMAETYRESLKDLPANRLNALRRELANDGAVHLLRYELLLDVLPWQIGDSTKKLQAWWDALLSSQSAVFDELLRWLAERLADPSQAQQVFPLAEALVLSHEGPMAKRASAIPLWNAIAVELPLSPISKTWEQAFSNIQGMNSKAEARLRVLKLMRQVDQQSRQPDWTPSQFPVTNPVWKTDTLNLPASERQGLIQWYVKLTSKRGISVAADARWLVSVLGAMGENNTSSVSTAVEQILAGRDPVTKTLVATAFADCALEDRSPEAIWLQYTRAILNRFNRDQQMLFVAFMQNRFGPSDRVHDEKVDQLLVDLELVRPQTSRTSSEKPKRETDRQVEQEKSGVGPSALPSVIQTPAGFLKKVFNVLRPGTADETKEDSSAPSDAAQERQRPVDSPLTTGEGKASEKDKNKQSRK